MMELILQQQVIRHRHQFVLAEIAAAAQDRQQFMVLLMQASIENLPLAAELLHPGLWISEIVYFPLETALLTAARERGCRVADGGGMAVGQAVGAFELFTGRSADSARMDAHFRRLVAGRHWS